MAQAMKTLTLVVTYNEADNISRLVPEILKVLPTSSVLVVDDDSPDGTARIVREMGGADKRIALICRTNDRGYGSATIAGLQHGIANGYESILTLDADFSHIQPICRDCSLRLRKPTLRSARVTSAAFAC